MNNKNTFKQIKNISSIFFIVILIFQMFAFGYVTQADKNIDSHIASIGNLKTDLSTTLINDVVRQEQRQTLNSIRQSWLQYIAINNSEILEKENDKYVFKNNEGVTMLFDTTTMDKVKNENNLYNIIDKNSKEILLYDARPVWNKRTITDILNIIAYPNKTFGERSNIIVYDLYSGEVLMDNSSTNNLCKEILDSSQNKNIKLYYKNPNNKNPEQYQRLVQQLLSRNDSQRLSGLTSLFYESNSLEDQLINDFSVYQFGDYNREFIEKIVLPYESIGIEGLDMQLGVLVTSQEQDIYEVYKPSIKVYDKILSDLKKQKEIVHIVPIICMILSLIIILDALCSIRLSAYYSRQSEGV